MPGTELRADFWMTEYITPWDYYAHGITKVLVHRKTAFQDMYIVECGSYGKALVLDGKWQSCTGDEFLYHEPLVHPAMLEHGGPKKVLILGGGEGATAREVLRWKTVEHVTMIDIDGEVVDACREHLPELHGQAFDDPRLDVVIDDALKFLDTANPDWDVVISDLTDPIEHGPSFKLFTREYFERIQGVLAPGGVFVVQAGPVAPVELAMHARLINTLRVVFKHVHSYTSYVPTYASPWGFALAASKPINTRPEPAATDAALTQNTTGGFRMLDGVALLGLFQLPLHIRRAIEAETRVYTLKEPPDFHGRNDVPKPAEPASTR